MGDLPGAATSQRVRMADQRCSGPLPIFPGGPHVDHMAVKVVADGCIGVQLRWTSGRAVLVDGARFIDCFYIDLCSIWDTICIRFGMCVRYDLLSPVISFWPNRRCKRDRTGLDLYANLSSLTYVLWAGPSVDVHVLPSPCCWWLRIWFGLRAGNGY